MCIVGETDYNSMLAVSPVATQLYFWSLIAILFLVMLNILLAIVIDEYEAIREEQESAARGDDIHFPVRYVLACVPFMHRHLWQYLQREAQRLSLPAVCCRGSQLRGSHSFIKEHLSSNPHVLVVNREVLIACGASPAVAL